MLDPFGAGIIVGTLVMFVVCVITNWHWYRYAERLNESWAEKCRKLNDR